MAFFRRHYNGFQVVIDRQSTADGYLWVVYSIVEDGFVGLTAPSLNEARGIAIEPAPRVRQTVKRQCTVD